MLQHFAGLNEAKNIPQALCLALARSLLELTLTSLKGQRGVKSSGRLSQQGHQYLQMGAFRAYDEFKPRFAKKIGECSEAKCSYTYNATWLLEAYQILPWRYKLIFRTDFFFLFL